MKNIIEELETKIAADCKPVNRESAFNDMLDECYSFESVGGIFATMSPSRVLLECDPVAHRCGVNDYADGQEWVEVGGETYQQDDVEKVKSDLLDEIKDELSSAETELQEADSDKVEECSKISQRIKELEEQISELEKHSF